MIDLFESIIKSHTVVILGEYVTRNKLSDAAKGMLAQGLRTPSLGTWQLFSRVLFEELRSDAHTWAFPDFPAEFAALDRELHSDKTNVIAFRNGYAHGATPDDTQCEADIARFAPFLEKLLQCRWLQSTRVVVHDEKVWIDGANAQICVHPVLFHKEEGTAAPFAFFNDLKNDKVGLLNYPLSKHYREKELFREFHEHLPLHEWRKSSNNEFLQRIEELTETFKGRIQERETLLQFIRTQNKGYFSIQGNPGIGKSALIAQFFKDLRSQKDLGEVYVVEYFIRRGTAQAQPEYMFNYLIRRTDEIFAQGREIRAEGKSIWDLQQQLFAKWRSWGEHSPGKKLLFMIDGLDEGTDDNVVSYLPRENFDGLIIVYGSRPGGHKSIDDLWSQLPSQHHTKLELTGLGKEDIRALIYEVANKYEVERDSKWIDAVQQRSQGNPLYLKLLCDAIEHRSIALNDIKALPEKIDEYYKAILDRYANDSVDGDALLAGLFTFAAASDFLSMAHLGLMNHLGDATLQRIGSTLKEVLYENPLTEAVLDYQLFHESFREYLIREKSKQVTDAAERILDFCATWQNLEGSWEQRYALEHYAAHASASKKESRVGELLDLLHNRDYAATQKKILKKYDATRELYRHILLKASAIKKETDALEAALKLIDLNYEEANDAPQVVALVAAGDIEMALKRIESFGGSDEEGTKRRFLLYMLCLMELTLLESKVNPNRRNGIEALLHHLDENLPVDHSILNWVDFFSSYLMFLLACEWAEMGLDYLMVYKRTNRWVTDWIEENSPYSDEQFEVIKLCGRVIFDEDQNNSTLIAISIVMAKQGKHDEAIEFARGINDACDKIQVLAAISTELANQGKFEKAEVVIKKAIDYTCGIDDTKDKSNALRTISTELAKQGKFEEALECACGLDDNRLKSKTLAAIFILLAKQGKHDEAIECARGINDACDKIQVLAAISTELANQGKFEKAEVVIKEAIEYARVIDDTKDKSNAVRIISTELAKQGKFEKALDCISEISHDYHKDTTRINISIELVKQGKIEEALECAREINEEFKKHSSLRYISIILVKQGKFQKADVVFEEALECARGIDHNRGKSETLALVSTELVKQGELKKAEAVIQQALKWIRGINDKYEKIDKLNVLSIELAKQGKFKKSLEFLECAQDIDNNYFAKHRTLEAISTELTKQGEFAEALEYVRGIDDTKDKSNILRGISTELAKQGKFEEALAYARGIDYKIVKSQTLEAISTELAKQGKFEEALECARGLDDNRGKSYTLAVISAELVKQGELKKAEVVIQEAFSLYQNTGYTLAVISAELAKQGKFEKAYEYALGIDPNNESKLLSKSQTLRTISIELVKYGKIEEAIEYARELSNEFEKYKSLSVLSIELAKQGKWSISEQLGSEIHQIAPRLACWQSMAEAMMTQDGWLLALQKVDNFKSDEAREFYLKGWASHLSVSDVNEYCLYQALPSFAGDTQSLEHLMQNYAIHKVLLGTLPGDQIRRLNASLNIQWALDLKASFNTSEKELRLSTNLDSWLHEFEDEDDRDQIELWAKQVAKGKISEEQFAQNMRGMN